MVVSAVCIVLLSAWSAVVSGQYVPASPCPDIFSYKVGWEDVYGLIRYQPPGSTKYIFMRATFVIETKLPSNYTGRLEVQGTRDVVLLRMLRGQSLDYRVDFPLARPLPSLATITVNGDVLCSGDTEYGSPSEFYTLEHWFFDRGDEYLSPSVLGYTNTANARLSVPLTPDAEVGCGLVSGGNEQVELVYRGKAVSPGQWPWLVAIFAKFTKSVDYICAGSLISNQHVITAAHCMSRLGVVKAKEDFVLKLGAFNLDNTNDPQVVARGVKSAAIHFYYDSRTLANDLLVLFLDSPVIFTQFIRPVCLWEDAIDLNEIVNKYGMVVGWGGNELHESGTGEPRMASVPIVSTETCRGTRKEFHDLTSRTTFCAGNRNGTGPCNGDSGGGLYMLSGGLWRLRGLVSVSLRPATGEARCNLQEYVVFTDVAQYLSWVRQHLARSNVRPPLLPLPLAGATVPQPESHSDAAGAARCGVVAGGNERVPLLNYGRSVSPGDWPWLVAIYNERTNLYPSCAGSLVSDQHVITAAHCLLKYPRKVETELGDFKVKAGAFDLSSSSEFAVTRGVSGAIIHPDFNAKNLYSDILILKLDAPLVFTAYIRPVCLWEGDPDQNLVVGHRGMVIGWGDREINNKFELRAASMPIVSTATCRASRQEYQNLTSKNTLCAGDRNGTGPCVGDAGGGLYILSGGRWRLRGVVSLSLRPPSKEAACNLNQYIVFTDVAQFLSWVYQIYQT